MLASCLRMAKLQAHTIHQWFADFVSALEETPSRRAFADLEPALVPAEDLVSDRTRDLIAKRRFGRTRRRGLPFEFIGRPGQ